MPDCQNNETTLLAMGAMLSKQQYSMNSSNINDYEFKIFSQFGDDGIIQYLIKNVEIKNEIFIEFGVENYIESNTRFLMMNNNWSGFVMDGSDEAMNSLKNQSWYWKYCLTHKAVFIDKDNINALLESTGFTNIGILHIDLDGNDYHILKEIDLSKLNPSIIIMEYNSVFGKDRLITVPYDKIFVRTNAHFSNLFCGASLPALNNEAIKKGYSLVGCNLAGNNAYFVRKDLLNEKVKELSIDKAYKESKFRESRNKDYSLSYIAGKERLELIKGLQVLNTETNQLEKL
jgi:hypothetical protein